jgi:integrase
LTRLSSSRPPEAVYIELNKWRDRVWRPALIGAGIEHRRIYDLRHTYATWSLAAGVSLFALSRRMGTSLAMIDATYGHLAPDAEDQERALLDPFDATSLARTHQILRGVPESPQPCPGARGSTEDPSN